MSNNVELVNVNGSEINYEMVSPVNSPQNNTIEKLLDKQ
jgi:hypothetical protein